MPSDAEQNEGLGGAGRVQVVRVLPDVAAIDREFDYVVPELWRDVAHVGAMVRVPLHGRRVGGWITAVDVEPGPALKLAPIAKVSGLGPSPEMIDLCRWASWRWSGRLATFLGTASPPGMVQHLPSFRALAPPPVPDSPWAHLFDQRRAVLRLPPAEDVHPVVLAAAARGDALVVCPSVAAAGEVATRLRRAGVPVALHPRDWARAAAGGTTVVGARAAAFAPMPSLAAVVVVDEHDEALQNEGSPTWHAREVALERARRARVPAVMVSPCPSLESVQRSPLVTVPRTVERAGWPVVEVIDRRDDDVGRTGLYSDALVRAVRGADGTVVCVLNRTGRAGLLACRTCGEITRCETCEAAVHLPEGDALVCRRCGTTRPVVCQTCGATRLANLRQGIGRAREELEALVGEPVVEISGATRGAEVPASRVYVGTEAVLHQVRTATVAAFLEVDQELTAPRYRAAEQAMGLLARAARLVGGRAGGGRILVQTRVPDHEVLRAAVSADPGPLLESERRRREITGFPPAVTMALVGGEAAAAFVEAFGSPLGVEVRRRDTSWLLVAEDRAVLLDALAATPRPGGRLKLQIDPMRLS
jgi:primosomal protein N' (replication factor Y)